MQKIILKNGLIAGLAVSIFMVCSMAYVYNSEHAEGSMLIGYASMLAAFSFVFIGIKNYRDKVSDGKITFFTAFKIGIAISATPAVTKPYFTSKVNFSPTLNALFSIVLNSASFCANKEKYVIKKNKCKFYYRLHINSVRYLCLQHFLQHQILHSY